MGHGKKPEVDRGAVEATGGFRTEFIRFLILFFIIWLLSYFLIQRSPGLVVGLQGLVSREIAWILTRLGYSFKLNGSSFLFYTAHGGENLVVIAECTGIYTSIIFFSIIGAYPARWWEKIAGVAVGLPAIHLLNLVRMVVVALILFHRRELFDLFHGYLWQVVFFIFMLGLVALWMGKVVGRYRPQLSGTRLGGGLAFVGRLVGVATALFLLQHYLLGDLYMKLVAHGARPLLALFGHRVVMERAMRITEEISLNPVVFLSLVLAVRKFAWRIRLRAAIVGVAVLTVLNSTVVFLAFLSLYRRSEELWTGTEFFMLTMNLFVPLLLWLLLVPVGRLLSGNRIAE